MSERDPETVVMRADVGAGTSWVRRSAAAAAVLTGLVSSRPAAADVELTARGPVAFLHSNRLQRADIDTFAQFLAEPRPQPLRIIYLDSFGGDTQIAIAIGRSIRSHGLATAFHVGHGRCVSACTTMFLGGRERYSIGADKVRDGIATHLGLGFHPSNGGAVGENSIADDYRDMGVEAAAELRYRVYSRQSAQIASDVNRYRLLFAGGRSALRTGVATRTSEPADPGLRD